MSGLGGHAGGVHSGGNTGGLGRINGMGAVKFPSGHHFGSGDIPMGYYDGWGLLPYDQFIITLDEPEEIEDDDKIEEKSMMDQLKSHHVKAGNNRKLTEYIRKEEEKLKNWNDNRKLYYIDKIKKAPNKKMKLLLLQQFETEMQLKKAESAERRRVRRVSKASKNLQIKK